METIVNAIKENKCSLSWYPSLDGISLRGPNMWSGTEEAQQKIAAAVKRHKENNTRQTLCQPPAPTFTLRFTGYKDDKFYNEIKSILEKTPGVQVNASQSYGPHPLERQKTLDTKYNKEYQAWKTKHDELYGEIEKIEERFDVELHVERSYGITREPNLQWYVYGPQTYNYEDMSITFYSDRGTPLYEALTKAGIMEATVPQWYIDGNF